MDIYDRKFNEALHDSIAGASIGRLLTEKLEALGVSIGADDIRRLASQLMRDEAAGKKALELLVGGRPIEFTPDDIQRINELGDDVMGGLDGLVHENVCASAASLLPVLRAAWPAESTRQKAESAEFEQEVVNRWGAALDGLAMLLTIACEIGSKINQHLRASAEHGHGPHSIDALTRLHARACQITDEVLHLTRAGFADGALARWRSLYEVTVVALFIREQDEDTAKRYIEHQVIESWRSMWDYVGCQERLGYEPVSAAEVEPLRRQVNDLAARYGSTFLKSYGWASKATGKKDPRITDLENAVKLDHLRAHYRLASHPVHGNPKGIFFQVSQHPQANAPLCGPSMIGLADPLHCTAISLMQITAALALLNPTIDHLVMVKIMEEIVQEIGEAAGAANDAQMQLIRDQKGSP